MDQVVIDSERVVQAGTGIADVGGQLAHEIATMHELLATIQGGWRSDLAAPRFAAAMQLYLEEAAALKDVLLSHGQTLGGSGRRFAEAEADLAAIVPGAH